MNIRKFITSALAGASMLALVGTASAAQIEVNIFGASAQYLFWSATAPNMLLSNGCSSVKQGKFDANNAITTATCGSDTVIIRSSAKASYDGPLSLEGVDVFASSGASNEKCSAGDTGDPGATLENGKPLRSYYRKMVSEGTCSLTNFDPAHPTNVPGTCTALKCVRVNMGLSDVDTKSFTQSSSGQKQGPLGGGLMTPARSFSGFAVDGTGTLQDPVTSSIHYSLSYPLTPSNPVVVPFAFFANNSVKKCVAATPTTWANCGSSDKQTITNIPRIMAVQIFSGQVVNWTDFGGDYIPNVPVVACFRHAGSGTHATLDYAVMNGAWGGSLISAENTNSANGTIAYFNDKSSDEMNCINGNGTTWLGNGAIGYSDADQSLTSYPNVVRLTYNGEAPSRVNIRNGRYDFFTMEWAFVNTNDPTNVAGKRYADYSPWIQHMIDFAGDPANMPGATWYGADKTAYWATMNEMVFTKIDDQHYPAISGAAMPQLP